MRTANVSGTTTHHARLLNTTNAHTSVGMSLAAFVSGGSHLLWLFRDVPKTLRLFPAKIFGRAKVRNKSHNALRFYSFSFLQLHIRVGSAVHYDFIVFSHFFRYLLLAISELMRIFAAEYKQLKL